MRTHHCPFSVFTTIGGGIAAVAAILLCFSAFHGTSCFASDTCAPFLFAAIALGQPRDDDSLLRRAPVDATATTAQRK